jgi:hypothetical protein
LKISFFRSNSIYLDTLIIVCLVRKVKIPAETAAARIKKTFTTNSFCKSLIEDSGLEMKFSITFIEFLIKPGVYNNNILANIMIINPEIRFNLYL